MLANSGHSVSCVLFTMVIHCASTLDIRIIFGWLKKYLIRTIPITYVDIQDH